MVNVTKVHYNPAAQVTAKAKSAIKAGTFVKIGGEMSGRNPLVEPATADATVLGVAAHDAAADSYVTVYRAGHILEVTSGAAIAAGDQLSAAAAGKAIKAVAGPVVAIALDKATAADQSITIALL